MEYELTMEVGDWSKDGHNQSDIFVFKSNKSLKKVQEAYKKGCEKLGFNLIEDYCCEYEDNALPLEIFQHFKELVIYPPDIVGDNAHICSEDWASMILYVAKLGDSKLQVELCKDLYNKTWKVGGYGFFC